MMTNFRPVSEEISRRAEDHPDSVALSTGAQALSYRGLDCKANQFAGYLVQLGVVPGDAVAICMERSFDWIVAALGAMRAGAAYVPLDSTWPHVRLRLAVNDSGAAVLVARAALLDCLQVKAEGVDPCRDAAAIASVYPTALKSLTPDCLAYIIYTSGSTGVPKGVEISHANLNHLVRWHRNAFSVTRQDRASHLMGLGFDAAVLEIWPHLSAGATLCLADEEVRLSPELMKEWLIRERVTIGHVPTVMGQQLIQMAWPADTALRSLVVGGDLLSVGPPQQLPFDVVNSYGPTECTVTATWSVLKPGAAGVPPIGRPITGTTLYLLDEEGKCVPDGEPGEIYIGGDGVGRGYRNLADLSARSFLRNPFSVRTSANMYRTGDRGERRADGQIQFRGRLDRQTKIRGFRVELDEIANTLSQYSGIDFATVVTEPSEHGENQLIAYVLPSNVAPAPTANQLQEHLLQSLPDYMVPSVFARLNTLPLSANGKIDLANLARFTDGHMLRKVGEKVRTSSVEEKVLLVVRELLRNDEVETGDNFFLAGGHSLLGMQLLLRLQGEFGVSFSLRQLFDAPTVASLAATVEMILKQEWLARVWAEVLGRDSVELDDNFFDLGGSSELLASIQRRIDVDSGRRVTVEQLLANPTVRKQATIVAGQVQDKAVLPAGVFALRTSVARRKLFWVHYLHAHLADVIGDDQSFFAVVLTAEDLESLGEAPTLQSIASCLLRKILETQTEGPYTIGGLCIGGILAYEIASQLLAAGHEVSLLVLVDSPNPSHIESCDTLARKLQYLRYVMKRAARLGPRLSSLYLRDRLFKGVPGAIRSRPTNKERSVVQELIETAAFKYRPKRYEGKALLLLASERPPHVNLLPGWQAVIPRSLYTHYVAGHHRDLTRLPHVKGVADAILRHLKPAADMTL